MPLPSARGSSRGRAAGADARSRGCLRVRRPGGRPHYPWEDLQFRLVLRELDAHDLRAVVHVGDIFWRPCTDAYYQRSLGWFNGLRHPVIYTPGDNEWFDCWEPGSGRFAPQNRLERIRKIFFASPARSLGGRPRCSSAREDTGSFPEFVENVRWVEQGFVFATVHVIGSMNGMRPFPRAASDDVESKRRTEAAAWVRRRSLKPPRRMLLAWC